MNSSSDQNNNIRRLSTSSAFIIDHNQVSGGSTELPSPTTFAGTGRFDSSYCLIPPSNTFKRKRDSSEDPIVINGGKVSINSDISNCSTQSVTSTVSCSECSAKISNSNALLIHIRRHLMYTPYRCSQCDFQGYEADDVRQHAAEEHTGLPWRVWNRPKIDLEAKVRAMVQKSKTLQNTTSSSIINSCTVRKIKDCSSVNRETETDNMNSKLALFPPAAVSHIKNLLCTLRQASLTMNGGGISQSGASSSNNSQPGGDALSNQSTTAATAAAFASTALLWNSLSNSGGSTTTGEFLPSLLHPGLSRSIGDSDNIRCRFCGENVAHNPVPIIRHLKAHWSFIGYKCSVSTNSGSKTAGNNRHVTFKTIAEFECNNLAKSHLSGIVDQSKNAVLVEMANTAARQVQRRELTDLVEQAFWDLGQIVKIKCSLCNEKVLWRSASLLVHLKSHLGYYPYKCALCSAVFANNSAVFEHVQSKHPASYLCVNFVCDPKSELDVESTFEKCFPVLAASFIENLGPDNRRKNLSNNVDDGNSNGFMSDQCGRKIDSSRFHNIPQSRQNNCHLSNTTAVNDDTSCGSGAVVRATVSCLMCKAKISRNMSCLIAHAKVHLAYKPLKCDYCTFRHFAMSKIRRHNMRVHADKPVKVSYHPVPDIGQQIKDMKVQCFGSAATSNIACSNNVVPAELAAEPTEMDSSILDIDDEPDSDFGRLNGFATNAKKRRTSELISEECTKDDSSTSPASVANLLRNFMNHQVNQILSAQSPPSNKNGDQSDANLIKTSIFDTSSIDGAGSTKRLCTLCNTFIAYNSNSFENHACKHLDYKPYHCFYCHYQSYIRGKVTRHIQQVHGGMSIRITHRPVPGAKDQIQRVKLQCFPFLSGTFEVGGLTLEALGAILTESTADESRVKSSSEEDSALIDADDDAYNVYNNDQDELRMNILDEEYECDDLMDNEFGDDTTGANRFPLDKNNNQENFCNIQMGDDGRKILASKNTDEKIACNLCSELINKNAKTLHDHCRKHRDSIIHQYCCSLCDYKADSETSVKHHARRAHKGFVAKVIFQQTDDDSLSDLHSIFQRCFETGRFFGLSRCWSDDATSRGSSPDSSVTATATTKNGPFSQTAVMLGNGRRLICRLCSGTVADNPKSIGIHVKNHLNYKPYRCPYCSYMSCEQSKARRHVEHVHNMNGDLIEIHTEEDVKEKVVEMKLRCFPSSFEQLATNEMMVLNGNNNELEFDSEILSNEYVDENSLKNAKPVEIAAEMNPDKKCTFEEETVYEENKFGLRHHVPFEGSPVISSICTPVINITPLSAMNDEERRKDKEQIPIVIESFPPKSAIGLIEGRLSCRVCEQSVSTNPNSLDVHVKNHLEYKPHSCPYCPYRSCIAGKVKRHLESVHRGEEARVISNNRTSHTLKQIIVEMRSLCFPSTSIDRSHKNRLELFSIFNTLKQRLSIELNELTSPNQQCQRPLQLSSNQAILPQMDPEEVEFQSNFVFYESTENSSFLFGTEDENEEAHVLNNDTCTKVKCRLCELHVPNSSAAIGLHARNHLAYKPYFCNLCEYTSCIKTSVRRHLLTHHKCTAPEITFKPSSDMIGRIAEMKRKCFLTFDNTYLTKKLESAAAPNDLLEEDDDEDEMKQEYSDDRMNDLKKLAMSWQEEDDMGDHKPLSRDDSMNYDELAPKLARQENSNNANDIQLVHKGFNEIQCHICRELISNDHLSKTKHLTKHLGEYEYRCPFCEFASFVQSETVKHLTSVHRCEENTRPIRTTVAAGGPLSSAYERLTEQCFLFTQQEMPEAKKTFCCALCDELFCVKPTDEADLTLLGHAVAHADTIHFKCSQCQFFHTRCSTVKAHCRTEHSGADQKISTIKDDYIHDASYDWLAKCFPDLTPNVSDIIRGSAGNRKITNESPPPPVLHVQQDLDENLDVSAEEFDENEDDEDEVGAPNTVANSNVKTPSDVSRYICQVCFTPVSIYASSLYVHVKNHMNYKPYLCGHCTYKSPVKSKVRRHIQNQHRNAVEIIHYVPTTGIEHEVLQWKKKCFPEAPAYASLANGKVPCLLCKTDVADSLLSKTVHVKNHLGAKPYHCEYCEYKSCLRGETRRHISRQHSGKAVSIYFVESEVATQRDIDDMMERCFLTGIPLQQKFNNDTIDLQKNSLKLETTLLSSTTENDKLPQVLQQEDEEDEDEIVNTAGPVSNCESASSSFRIRGYNLRNTARGSVKTATAGYSTHKDDDINSDAKIQSVKLGQAYRERHCGHCSFKAHSKYEVKRHCLHIHPGKSVEVSDRKLSGGGGGIKKKMKRK